jgi:hypothetical protein
MLSVGKILRDERERQGVSLQAVEKQIRVREKLLKAIEDNHWDCFSSKVYIAGIIKNYSKFLNLDQRKMLAFFRRDYERREEVKFKTRVSSQYLTSGTKKIAIIGLSLVFLIFFSYFGYQLSLYLAPPKVEIISPKTDKFTKEDRVRIVGKSDKEVMITIFGERVYQNKDGVFEYDFPLHDGSNELSVEVVGANGKKTTIKKVFFKKSSS